MSETSSFARLAVPVWTVLEVFFRTGEDVFRITAAPCDVRGIVMGEATVTDVPSCVALPDSVCPLVKICELVAGRKTSVPPVIVLALLDHGEAVVNGVLGTAVDHGEALTNGVLGSYVRALAKPEAPMVTGGWRMLAMGNAFPDLGSAPTDCVVMGAATWRALWITCEPPNILAGIG